MAQALMDWQSEEIRASLVRLLLSKKDKFLRKVQSVSSATFPSWKFTDANKKIF